MATDDVSDSGFDFKPIHTSWQMKRTPFPINQQANYMLSVLKRKLVNEVKSCDFGLCFTNTCRWLTRYISMFGYCFSKEDHHLFITLLYHIVLDKPTQMKEGVEEMVKLLDALIKKKKKIVPGELVLDWRPLFDRCLYLLASNNFTVASTTGIDVKVLVNAFVRQLKIFFDIDATPAILEEIRRLKCRGKTQSPFPKEYLYPVSYKFLPVLIPAGKFDRTVGLWIDNVIDEFLEEDDIDALIDFSNVMSKVALFNCGRVNWDRCMGRVVSMELSRWNVPFDLFDFDRSVIVPIKFKPSEDGLSTASKLIINSITPASNTLDLLERVAPALSFVCDPSVLSLQNRAIYFFFSDMILYLKRRLFQERVDGGSYVSWSEVTPAECRLSDEQVERVVNFLLPPLETMLFGKLFTDEVTRMLGRLALIRPPLVVPRVISLIEGEFSRLTEPHRVFNALKMSSELLCGVLNVSALGPPCSDRRTWILDVLPTVVGFISVNDDKKTTEAVNFLRNLVSRVPLLACRHPMKNSDKLCKRSQELEEFLITYTELVLSYAQESTDIESGQAPSVQHIVQSLLEVLRVAMRMAPSSVRRRAADLVLSSLSGGRFPWSSTPTEWTNLMEPFADNEPEHCLPKLLRVAEELMAEMEEDYDCSETGCFPASIPAGQVNEVIAFVTMIFFVPQRHLREHQQVVQRLFLKCFKFRGSQILESLEHLIRQVVRAFEKHFVSLGTADIFTCVSDDPASECVVKRWGLIVHTDSWRPSFVPSPEPADYEFRNSLLGTMVASMTARLLQLSSDLSNEDKMEVRQTLSILAALVRNVAESRFQSPPPDTHLGTYDDVPSDIRTERLMLLKEAPEIVVDGERLWDLLLKTVTALIDRPGVDYETWGTLFELAATMIVGDDSVVSFQQFKSASKIRGLLFLEQDKSRQSSNGSRNYFMKKKMRFLGDSLNSLDAYLQRVNSCVWAVSALSPSRWQLLQNFYFSPVPSKEALPFVFVVLNRCLEAYPDAAEHLLAPMAGYLRSLSDEYLKDKSYIPICRLMCVAKYVRRTSSWAVVLREFFQLLARCSETRMGGNGDTKDVPNGSLNGNNSLDWLRDSPKLDELCRRLEASSPTLDRPSIDAAALETMTQNKIQEAEQFLAEAASLLDSAKEQLLRPMLRTLNSFFSGNTDARVLVPRSMAESLLRLLRTCLNPSVHYAIHDLLRDVATSEAVRRRLQPQDVGPEELAELCAWPDKRPDGELVPAVTCCGGRQTAFVWQEVGTARRSEFVQAFCETVSSPQFVNELVDTYLQLQRTSQVSSNKHIFMFCLTKALAALVGPAILSSTLQSRLLAMLEENDTTEMVSVYGVLVGLLCSSGDWSVAEHEQLCAWAVPVLESGVTRGRFSASSLSSHRNPLSLLNGGLGDPRRIQPLWDFLLGRLERSGANLEERESEQLVNLLVSLLEGFRTWRVAPLLLHLDKLLQPLVAGSLVSLRHSPLVKRWLVLSLLPSDDAQLQRLFGHERVAAPSLWLRSLFSAERRREDVREMPEWILRLGYLCPRGLTERQFGFGDVLLDHLDLVLIARGNNAQVNDETTRDAIANLPGLSLVLLRRCGRPEHLRRVLDKIRTIFRDAEDVSDRTMCATLSLWRQALCRNVVLLPGEVTEEVYNVICCCLRHEAPSVVRAATQASSELLRRGVISPDSLLLKLKSEALPTTAMANGLSAMIEAFPHRLFGELEEVLQEMKLLLKQDPSQRVVIEKAVRNFMRSHQDAWEERWKSELTDSSLAYIRDLCGSGSYFS